MLGSGAISWSSKKQTMVATPSCEVEYIACDHAVKEAMWLWNLLAALNHRQECPMDIQLCDRDQNHATKIDCDNQSMITLSNDTSFHARCKHIDVKYHHVREHAKTGNICLHYLLTAQMTTDSLTKALTCPKHKHFTELMGLKETTMQ